VTRRRVLVLGLSSLALAAALLGASEIGARIAFPKPPVPSFYIHPLLGFLRPPGYHANRVSIETGKPFVYSVNKLGLRSHTLETIAKPAGTYRIVFLGGSTTENSDLPEEETFPGRIEARLVERFKGSPRIEVGNAGFGGASTNVELAQLAHRVLALDPDLVVFLDPAMNDLHESLRADWEPTTYYLAQPQGGPRFNDWLVGQSRLLAVLSGKYSTTEAMNGHDLTLMRVAMRRERPVLEPPADFDLGRGIPRFKANQRRMVRLCADEGIPCVLMTEPTLLKENMTKEEDDVIHSVLIVGTDWNLRPATELAALERYNDATREDAAKEGALLADTARDVPRDLEHFSDDVHLTRAGNEAIADSVLRVILATGSLPGRRK
jgi:lysophospholipase L1-like esterase